MKKMLLTIAAVTAITIIGLTIFAGNKAEAAEPGQVGSAPRCTVDTGKPRTESFDIRGENAKVEFKVTGSDNCKVQVSVNSFYSPSLSGQPWSEQILFQRETKVFTKGTHTMSGKLPTKSTPAKGCFYQIDLTYGIHNVLPVLAGKRDKIEDCGKKPAASCEALTVTKLSRTIFRFTAKADTQDGAKINTYDFTVTKDGKTVDSKVIRTDAKSTQVIYGQNTTGAYKVAVAVKTTEGEKTAAACKQQFTVTALPPEKIEVCEIATKKIVEINKSAMSDKYTTDLTKCNVPPVTTSTPQTPTALPNTGAGAVAAIFSGVTSLAGIGHYFFTRRFGL